jgi:hypothetical protein
MKYISFFLAAVIFVSGCKERYDIPVKATSQALLVVEGLLNSGNGITKINLSRTATLNRSTINNPELQAQLSVEGNDNSSFPLLENGGGVYSAQLSLNNDKLYRLRIHTSNGKEYVSDFVPVKNTPDIDTVGWERSDKGVGIYLNTHDPQNNTRYYRWEYTETWEIHSTYFALYRYVNGQIVPLNLPAEDISVCWKTNHSSSIILGSSARLVSDDLRNIPMVLIPPHSDKLSVRYSILVKQYALTRAAYDYFQVMKTNTESLGTIFDPQPSDIRGNIRNVNDPQERVIGMITAGDVKEKRIFIRNTDVQGWDFSMYCPTFFVDDIPDSIKKYIPSYYPYSYSGNGYWVSTPACVDCTIRGGITTKPSFW